MNDARQQIEAAQEEFSKKIAELENRKDLDPRVLMQMHGAGADSAGADARRADQPRWKRSATRR